MFSGVKEPTSLEKEIERAVRELKNHPIGSEEYVRTLDQIVKLHRMKEEEKPSAVSKDTLVLAGVNLLGIIMIIRHEHVNVITSRAMNMVIRPR
jgi:hypothetical protein